MKITVEYTTNNLHRDTNMHTHTDKMTHVIVHVQ